MDSRKHKYCHWAFVLVILKRGCEPSPSLPQVLKLNFWNICINFIMVEQRILKLIYPSLDPVGQPFFTANNEIFILLPLLQDFPV